MKSPWRILVGGILACAAWQGCTSNIPDDVEGTPVGNPQPRRLQADAGEGTADGGSSAMPDSGDVGPKVNLCAPGKTQCGLTCVDTTVSLAHCGACDNACTDGKVCTPGGDAGAATCSLSCTGGTVRCGEACSRLESDPANCGQCGRTCAAGQACLANACVGITCTPGAQEICYSGTPEIPVGTCRAGKKTCNEAGTAFGPCVGETLPTTEVCGDNADNDCDGLTDEGCTSTLTITKSGTGSGSVTSSPFGIDCGGTCSSTFPIGTRVTLTAQPTANHSFVWSGACTGSNPTCVVDVSGGVSDPRWFNADRTTFGYAKNVGISFTPPPACNGRQQSFTYSTTKSFYNLNYTPACTATTLVATARNDCAPGLVDMKFNGTVGAQFLQQNISNTGILTVYHTILWPGAPQPVSTLNLTLSNLANRSCSVAVALN